MKNIAIACLNENIRENIKAAFDVEYSIVYVDLSSVDSAALLAGSHISLIMVHLDSFNIDRLSLIDQIMSINPKATIFVLSDIPSFAEAKSMIEKGAKGYANSKMLIDGIRHAIASVEYGDIWMPPSFVLELIKNIKKNEHSADDIVYKLSKKEYEVAKLIALGNSNQEIADFLDISERTVKSHLTTIYEKLNIKDRLSLALMVKNT